MNKNKSREPDAPDKRYKLFRLLAALKPREFKRFRLFVQSPFYNQTPGLAAFVEAIAAAYPAFHPEAVDSALLYRQLFPGEPYDDLRMRTLRKQTLKLAEQFLVALRLEREPGIAGRALLMEAADRNIDEFFPEWMEEARRQLDAYSYRNELYFWELFFLERLDLQYRVRNQSRLEAPAYEQLLLPLDQAFLIQKLGNACAAINHRSQLNQPGELDIPLLEPMMAHCQAQETALSPTARAYYLALRLLMRREDDEALPQLLELMQSQPEQFHPVDLLNLCGYAINYSNQQYRQGNEAFQRTMFSIYRFMLAQELLFDQARLSVHHYKNLCTLGIRLQEFEWTAGFIEQYRDRIDPEYRDSIYRYNLAYLSAALGDHRKALRLLQDVDFLDPFYRISHNLLLLKIYWECREIEPLFSLIQSFGMLLRRKHLLPRRQFEAYHQFTRLLRKLALKGAIQGAEPADMERLRLEIQQAAPLIDREWLLEQAEGLMRRGAA